jgi:hypothetical protein
MATTDPRRTGIAGGVIETTWANRPSSANASQLYLFTDVGESCSLWRYAGGRWRALAGQAMLRRAVPVSGIATAETIVMQSLLPAGSWQIGDEIRLRIAGAKSGATDVGSVTVRVGTAGTTADTAVTGLSAFQLMAGTQRGYGVEFGVCLVSATSAQKVGVNANGNGSYSTSTATAVAAATAITDASSNALWISLGLLSAGATDTLSLQSGSIQLITP